MLETVLLVRGGGVKQGSQRCQSEPVGMTLGLDLALQFAGSVTLANDVTSVSFRNESSVFESRSLLPVHLLPSM